MCLNEFLPILFLVFCQNKITKALLFITIIVTISITAVYGALYYSVVLIFLPVALIACDWKIYKALRRFVKKSDIPLVLAEWKPVYAEKTQSKIDEVEDILAPFLKDFRGKFSHHMGSTSIVGMMGKPSPDFTVVTEGLLPNFPDLIIEKLSKKGWEYLGPSPHCFDKCADHWFHLYLTQEEQEINDGILSDAMHIVSIQEANKSMVEFLNFRDYCNQNEDARNRYKDAKLKGHKTIMKYSLGKKNVVMKIRDEAREWAKSQQIK